MSTAKYFTEHVGFFFYKQVAADPCTTIYTGFVDDHLGLSNMTNMYTISGPFKTILFGFTQGLGDYTGIVKEGLQAGYLFPTWSEPVATSVTCARCQNVEYNLRIRGARILWP